MHAQRPPHDPSDASSLHDPLAPDLQTELASLRAELAAARKANAQQAAQLQELRAQVQQLEQLKTDFLNAASHELRTPLTSIKGYAEFLEDGVGGPLTEQQRTFVVQIQVGTTRLRRIVDDMLDFARLEAGTFQIQPLRTDLARLVASETASLMPQAVDKGVALETRIHPRNGGPYVANVDPVRVGQVLTNLVDNAIKFTPAGGRVVVTLDEATPGFMRLAVRDTGIGIAPALLERVFDKFYQVNPTSTREQGGAGLGLSISRALTEAHGCMLGVESEPGLGSLFWFVLPDA